MGTPLDRRGALVRGREALERQAWSDAYARLAAADAEAPLGPADLEGAALAAYLTGRDDACEALWARGHAGRVAEGDHGSAARCAFWLGFPLLLRGEAARGGGWLARARRALDEGGNDCAERGLLLVSDGLETLRAGDAAGALETFEKVEEVGARFADPDVLAFGRLGQGQALIGLGNVRAAVPLLDEAMVAVTAGEVSPIASGVVYCAVLLACRQTFDLARAEEWTSALARWCDAQQDLVPFRGECLVHRAEVLQARGEWPEALAEARKGCDRLAGRSAAGRAHYLCGEVHRLRGAFRDADEAYRAASAHGLQPQPGCALLRLAQGHPEAADSMIRRAAADVSGPARANVLPAVVEIALATGGRDAARLAADELAGIAAAVGATLLNALAAHAQGSVLLSEDDPRAALGRLRDGGLDWRELGAPYEAARTRVATGLACRALGDEESASLELDAARSTFADLGAAPDRQRVERLSGAAAAGGGLTGRELEVLALVAEGRTNGEIAAALVISPHTVRRHLQNVFRKLGVSSRAAATAVAVRSALVPAGRDGVARTDHKRT